MHHRGWGVDVILSTKEKSWLTEQPCHGRRPEMSESRRRKRLKTGRATIGTRPSKIGAQPYKDITWKCHKPRMTKPEVFRGIEPKVQTYPAKDCSRMLDSKLKKWGRPKSPWIDCGGKKTHKGEKREDNPNRQKRKNYLTKQDRSPSGTIFF